MYVYNTNSAVCNNVYVMLLLLAIACSLVRVIFKHKIKYNIISVVTIKDKNDIIKNLCIIYNTLFYVDN